MLGEGKQSEKTILWGDFAKFSRLQRPSVLTKCYKCEPQKVCATLHDPKSQNPVKNSTSNIMERNIVYLMGVGVP